MSQILVISNDRDIRTNLSNYLSKYLGSEVILQDSARNAIPMMQLIPDINLIICKDIILKEPTAQKVCEFLLEHNKDHSTNIPIIILGDKPAGFTTAIELSPKAAWQVLVSEAASILGIKPLIAIPTEEPVYFSLNIKYYLFLVGMNLKFESYLKVKNKNKEYEYDLIINIDQVFERINIEKLIKTGVRKLYIPKHQISAAISTAKAQLIKTVRLNQIDAKDRIQFNSDCYDLSLDLARGSEVDEFLYEFLSSNLKAMILATSDVRALEHFMKKRKQMRVSYAFSHFYLSCLIMQAIIKNFKWATPDLKQKIVYLLYLHDLTLEDDILIQVHHSYSAKFHQIKPKEREIVLGHAKGAAMIALKFKDLYPDLPDLVREHHGVTAGNNMLDTLSLLASPITMTLIVVEDFVTQYLDLTEEPNKENYQSIFSNMEKRFVKITYTEALKAVKKLIDDGEEKIMAEKAATLAATKAAQSTLTTAVAAMAAAEQVLKAEADKTLAESAVIVAMSAVEHAAASKANLDKELALALTTASKLKAEQAQAEKLAAIAIADAEAKMNAAKKAAKQSIAVAKHAADKANAIVDSINNSLHNAKAEVMKTIAEKAASEKAVWQAAEKAKASLEAKRAADKAALEAKEYEAQLAAARLTNGKTS